MRKKLQWNLKMQFLVTMVALVLLSTLSLGFAINQKVTGDMEKNFYDATRKEIMQVSGAMNLYFSTVNESVEYFAKNPLVQQIDGSITSYVNAVGKDGTIQMTPSQKPGIESEIYNLYVNYAKTHPSISYIYLGTKEGGYIQWPEGTSKDKYDPRTRAWYTQAIENPDKVKRTGAYASFTGNVPIVSSSVTIKDKAGNVVGVQGVDVSLEALTQTINNIKIGETYYVILTDETGTILANPKNPETNFKTLKDLNVKAFADIDKMTDKHFEVSLNGKSYTVNVYVSPETHWKYIAMMDKSEIAESTKEIQRIIYLVMLIIVVIVIAISLFISRAIAKPLNASVHYLQQIGSGNLATEIPESMLKKATKRGPCSGRSMR